MPTESPPRTVALNFRGIHPEDRDAYRKFCIRNGIEMTELFLRTLRALTDPRNKSLANQILRGAPCKPDRVLRGPVPTQE